MAKSYARRVSRSILAAGAAGLLLAPLASHAGAQASAPTQVTIAADTWSFKTPARIPAGLVDITINGKQQVDATVAKLNAGVSRNQIAAAIKSGQQDALGPLVTPMGGPDGAGTAEGILDLSAGTYVIYSADHGSAAKANVKYQFITVSPSSAPVVQPSANVTVSELDFKFRLGAVPAGQDTLKIVNLGPSVHETVIARLNPGKTFKDLMSYFSQQKPSGPPPGQMLGGANAIAPNQTQWLKANFTPGNYVLICFMPDKHGQPHVMDGMYKTFTVR